MRILSRAFRIGAAVTVAVGVSVGLAVSAQAGDSPAGFNFGTDSSYVSVLGPAPYRNPVMGGNYGGYVGMVGNWARVEGCTTGNFLDFSYSNRDQANTDYNTYHIGIGTAAYWYMGGPGVDPNWNGSTAEAANWGAQQARACSRPSSSCASRIPCCGRTSKSRASRPPLTTAGPACTPHHAAGRSSRSRPDGSWTARSSTGSPPTSPRTRSSRSASTPRPAIWQSIFGTGSASLIPNTYEWTYWPETSNLNAYPYAWRLSQGKSTSYAQFFGGQTYSSPFALDVAVVRGRRRPQRPG